MPAKIKHDVIKIIIDIFDSLYPERSCTIEFVDGLHKKTKAYGETFWPDDCSDPSISIDVNTTFIGVVEVLAHELAHVATGHRGHGEVWETALGQINNRFNKEMDKNLEGKE